MKKTMFKKVFAGITAMFMMCLFLPIGFTGTNFKPSLETAAESDVLTISQGTTIDDCQFRGNTSIKEVKIGDNCTIGAYAFSGCTNLETVEIGKNCIIGTWAFENCLNLSSVTIGEGCKIESNAFGYCTNLKNVTIGEGCTIGEKAFWECTALENVIFNGTCVEADKISVGDGNPEIITNKSKWKIDHAFGKNGKCKICGYCKKISKSEIGSTFSNGSVLVIIGGSIFLILCGLAAVIIVKRRKKTQ